MINFFKKGISFKKKRENSCVNIGFFWKLSVIFMFIVFLSACFFGYYLFVKVNKEVVFETNEENSEFETIKQDKIEKILEYFSVRKQKSNGILNSSAPVVDPSL